jgi:hypothetical protein
MAMFTTTDQHDDIDVDIDHEFGRAVLKGYMGGFVVFFLLTFLMMSAFSHLAIWGRLGASLGVAVWIGIMGGVIGVGGWVTKRGH